MHVCVCVCVEFASSPTCLSTDEPSVPALRGTAPDLDARTVSAYTAAQVVRVVVGGVFHSTVQVLDNYGAPMRLHRDAVVVVIEEPGGGELPEVHVSDALDDGRFAVEFVLQQPGIHTLGMIVNGKAITQSEVLIEVSRRERFCFMPPSGRFAVVGRF